MPAPATCSSAEFGAHVQRLRLQQQLSVYGFAKRAGVSPETVEKLEAGHSEFELNELFAIGRGLGMDVSALFRTWEARVSVNEPSRNELQ